MEIIWSPLAEKHLIEYAEYIAYDKPVVAIQWLESAYESVEKLSAYPMFGRKVPEFNLEKYREIIFGRYRIIYRLEEKKILILTVKRSSQLLVTEELLLQP